MEGRRLRRRSFLSKSINMWRGQTQAQWGPLSGKEEMGTTWKARGFLWTSGITSLLCKWLKIGTSYPERLWSLLSWRSSSKVVCMWTWATLGDPAWAGDWNRWTQRLLPTSIILWLVVNSFYRLISQQILFRKKIPLAEKMFSANCCDMYMSFSCVWFLIFKVLMLAFV